MFLYEFNPVTIRVLSSSINNSDSSAEFAQRTLPDALSAESGTPSRGIIPGEFELLASDMALQGEELFVVCIGGGGGGVSRSGGRVVRFRPEPSAIATVLFLRGGLLVYAQGVLERSVADK